MSFDDLYRRFANPGESPDQFAKRWTEEQQQLIESGVILPIMEDIPQW